MLAVKEIDVLQAQVDSINRHQRRTQERARRKFFISIVVLGDFLVKLIAKCSFVNWTIVAVSIKHQKKD